jgi:malate synthase
MPKPRFTVSVAPEFKTVLTPEALKFLGALQKQFNPQRLSLLAARQKRLKQIKAGKTPTILHKKTVVDWKVAPAPADLNDRRVEITGPVDRKMIINALNSGAKVFMADFEDSTSPTWLNVMEGQVNLMGAVRRTLAFTNEAGKQYKLNDKLATLVVRPRGWHLDEAHMIIAGEPMSASLFDFGLYFFHNAAELIARGSGPYFYLPKMESHLEARLWNDVFNFSQDYLGIPRGTVRATVLIETITAAFEMEEILYELKEHSSGLNAGRWDYIFSMIKKFRHDPDMVLPGRSQVSMAVPFMQAYCRLLVNTCHRRGAHALGGMAAFIPNKQDKAVTEAAFAKVKVDKQREANLGFDGTWVAHPDLIATAMAEFDQVLGAAPNQKAVVPEISESLDKVGKSLVSTDIEGGTIGEADVRNNISVTLRYLAAWLAGTGAVAIDNLMEDAATAEISRSQLWQWLNHEVVFTAGEAAGKTFDAAMYKAIRKEELKVLISKAEADKALYLREAAKLLDRLVLNKRFIEFLTLPAYAWLCKNEGNN